MSLYFFLIFKLVLFKRHITYNRREFLIFDSVYLFSLKAYVSETILFLLGLNYAVDIFPVSKQRDRLDNRYKRQQDRLQILQVRL
jgi:hypothetical protein